MTAITRARTTHNPSAVPPAAAEQLPQSSCGLFAASDPNALVPIALAAKASGPFAIALNWSGMAGTDEVRTYDKGTGSAFTIRTVGTANADGSGARCETSTPLRVEGPRPIVGYAGLHAHQFAYL